MITLTDLGTPREETKSLIGMCARIGHTARREVAQSVALFRVMMPKLFVLFTITGLLGGGMAGR